MEEICPLCCAGKRSAECGDCQHYTEAQRYDRARTHSAARPEKHFFIELNPEVEETVNTALELAQTGSMDRPWETMTRLLREYPKNHMVFYGMGTLHAIKGEHAEAIPWFDKALAQFPYFTEACFNKAVACQKLVDIAGAVRAYRRVVDMCEKNDTTAQMAKELLAEMAGIIRGSYGVDLDSFIAAQDDFDHAFASMEQGEWVRAMTGFRASAEKNDGSASTHGNLGLCLAQLGRKAEALAELDRALKIDPDYEPAKRNRVLVEEMEEGRALSKATFKSINFYHERHRRTQCQ